MRATYTPSRLHPRSLPTAALAIVAAAALFAMLPLLHITTQILRPPAPILPPGDATPIPKSYVEPVAPRAKPPLIEKLKFEPPRPPATIREFELSINATGEGALAGHSIGFVDSIGIDQDVFDWDAVEEKPRVLVAVTPRPPLTMERDRADVVVEFVIDARGRPDRIRVVRSSRREFESAAIDAVKRSKWKPGAVEGKAVSTRVRLPVLFNPRS